MAIGTTVTMRDGELPADPLGANADAVVAAGAVGSISAKLRRATQALEDLKTQIVLATGEAHLGSIGGDGDILTVTPSLNVAGAYAAGDLVGQKNTIASAVRVSGGRGTILSVTIADKAKQAAALDLVFFGADPTGTTFTDNGPFTPVDADLLKIIGHVAVLASDYSQFADNAVATRVAVGLMFEASVSTIYMAVVSRGAPTYTDGDLQIKIALGWD